MDLLFKEKQAIKNDYFPVWEIVELIYKKANNDWKSVVEFLGHHNFFSGLALFEQEHSYKIHEVYDNKIKTLIDLIETSYSLTKQGEHHLNLYLLESDQSEREEICLLQAKGIASSLLWRKQDIYNFMPIMELGIIEKPKKEISFSKAPKPISPLNGVSYTNTVDTPSYLRVLALSDYFTIFDAACLMSLDEPEIANDINYDDSFRYGEHKQAIKVIESGIKANKLQVDSEWQIPRRSLQYFLHERGYILSGFNDKLPEQELVGGEISSIQESPQEIELLKADLAKAQERIKELEQKQKSDEELYKFKIFIAESKKDPEIRKQQEKINHFGRIIDQQAKEIANLKQRLFGVEALKEKFKMPETPEQEIESSKTRNSVSVLIAVLCELNNMDITQPHGDPNKLILGTAERLGAKLGKDFVGKWLNLAKENIK